VNGQELQLVFTESATAPAASYDAFVFVYSVASAASFRAVELALEQLSTQVDFQSTPVVVAAAQIDRVDEHQVELQDADDLTRRYHVPVTQVSAKEHQGIDTLFETLIRDHFKKKRRRDKQALLLASAGTTTTTTTAAANNTNNTNTTTSSSTPAATKLSHKCLVTREIRDTEFAYVQYLERAITCFKRPLEQLLREKKDKAVVSDEQLNNIFYNVEDIYVSQKALLDKLTARIDAYSDERTLVGDLFIEHVPTLRNHIDYVRHHQRAIITVNDLENRRKEFVAFCDAQKTKHNLLLGLLAHLITPCQRIPRYRLLLQELLKRTDDAHPDRQNLTRALAQVEQVATAVNEAIREQENFQKVVDIQKSFEGNVKTIVADGRLYVRDGTLMKVCKKVPKPRHFFLFSDSLVYAEVESEDRFVLRRQMPLSECGVKDVPDSKGADGALMANGFQVIGTDKSFTVLCATPDEKRAWIEDLAKRCGHGHGEQGETAAPVWVPDTHTVNCMTCDVKFTTFNRRHHCRKCGACVCNKCSTYRTKLLFLKDEKPVRVCVRCWDDIQEQDARRQRLDSRYKGDSSREQPGAAPAEPVIELAGSKEHKQVVNDLSKVLTQRKATGNAGAPTLRKVGSGAVAGAPPQPGVSGANATAPNLAPAPARANSVRSPPSGASRGSLLSSAPGAVVRGPPGAGPGRLQRGQSLMESVDAQASAVAASPGMLARTASTAATAATETTLERSQSLQYRRPSVGTSPAGQPPSLSQTSSSSSQPGSPRRAAVQPRTASRGPLPVLPSASRRPRAGAQAGVVDSSDSVSARSDTSSRSTTGSEPDVVIPAEPTQQHVSAPPEPPAPVFVGNDDDDDEGLIEREAPLSLLPPDDSVDDDTLLDHPPLPVEPTEPDAPPPILVAPSSSLSSSSSRSRKLIEYSTPTVRQVCRAIVDVDHIRTGRLMYKAGTEIVALEAVEGKYWRGELPDGTIGIFSLQTVELLESKVPPPVPNSAPPGKLSGGDIVGAPAVPTSKPPPVPTSRPPGSE
jgi:hypothetical protein